MRVTLALGRRVAPGARSDGIFREILKSVEDLVGVAAGEVADTLA